VQRHQCPERPILRQISSLMFPKIHRRQVVVNGLRPGCARPPRWSPPVLWRRLEGLTRLASAFSSVHARCPKKVRRRELMKVAITKKKNQNSLKEGKLVDLLCSSRRVVRWSNFRRNLRRQNLAGGIGQSEYWSLALGVTCQYELLPVLVADFRRSRDFRPRD